MSFDPKEKQSVISCRKPVKEHQKFVTELCIGSNRMHMASIRDSLVSIQVQLRALMC